MNDGKIILYRTDDGQAALSLYARDGSVWMNQAQLAELFATSVQNISLHIINVLKDKELSADSVIKEYLNTATDGKESINLLRLNKTERGKTVTLKRANGEAFGVRQQALIITHKSQGRDLVVRREARNERHAAFASRRMVQTTERPRPPRRPHAPVAQRGAYKAVSRSFLACHRTTRSSHAFSAASGVTTLCRGAVAPLPLVGNGESRLPHSTALRADDCRAGACFREEQGGGAFGVRQPAAAFLSQPAGDESFGAPKQSGFRVFAAFGVERCGASVLPTASRLAGESGSRLPHSTALRADDCRAGAYFREKVGGRK